MEVCDFPLCPPPPLWGLQFNDWDTLGCSLLSQKMWKVTSFSYSSTNLKANKSNMLNYRGKSSPFMYVQAQFILFYFFGFWQRLLLQWIMSNDGFPPFNTLMANQQVTVHMHTLINQQLFILHKDTCTHGSGIKATFQSHNELPITRVIFVHSIAVSKIFHLQ